MSIIMDKTDANIDIGMSGHHREAISVALGRLLADTYMLYLKTHNYHWNVTGMNFMSLHEMFEEQYTELAQAVDVIAEHIRSLGHFAPGSFNEFSKLTNITEDDSLPDDKTMIQRLLESNETVIRTAREALPSCEEAGDEASLDLVTERLRYHSKVAWMLRSHLQ